MEGHDTPQPRSRIPDLRVCLSRREPRRRECAEWRTDAGEGTGCQESELKIRNRTNGSLHSSPITMAKLPRLNTSMVSIAAVIVVSIALSGQTPVQKSVRPARFQVVEKTIDEIHAAMKINQLTAHELVQAYLDRINAFDKKGPAVNCIITLNSQALQEADKLDAAFKRT